MVHGRLRGVTSPRTRDDQLQLRRSHPRSSGRGSCGSRGCRLTRSTAGAIAGQGRPATVLAATFTVAARQLGASPTSHPIQSSLLRREREAALSSQMRLVDAEHRKAEIEVALAGGPGMTQVAERCACMSELSSGCPRDMIFEQQPGPGSRPLCRNRSYHTSAMPARAITNSGVRQWVSDLLASGPSAATTRKAVFALRQCLAAAIAENRLQLVREAAGLSRRTSLAKGAW